MSNPRTKPSMRRVVVAVPCQWGDKQEAMGNGEAAQGRDRNSSPLLEKRGFAPRSQLR